MIRRCCGCLELKDRGRQDGQRFFCSQCLQRQVSVAPKLMTEVKTRAEVERMEPTNKVTLENAAEFLMEAAPEEWEKVAQKIRDRIAELDTERERLTQKLKFVVNLMAPVTAEAKKASPVTEQQRSEIYRLADEGMQPDKIKAQLGLKLIQVKAVLARRTKEQV